jgi:hypothetical protein
MRHPVTQSDGSGQLEAFTVPPYSDNDTSREAALAKIPTAAVNRRTVYALLRSSHGLTSDEIQLALGWPSQSVSPRLWELEGNKGHPRLIYKSDDRRPTRYGLPARVYRVIEGA